MPYISPGACGTLEDLKPVKSELKFVQERPSSRAGPARLPSERENVVKSESTFAAPTSNFMSDTMPGSPADETVLGSASRHGSPTHRVEVKPEAVVQDQEAVRVDPAATIAEVHVQGAAEAPKPSREGTDEHSAPQQQQRVSQGDESFFSVDGDGVERGSTRDLTQREGVQTEAAVLAVDQTFVVDQPFVHRSEAAASVSAAPAEARVGVLTRSRASLLDDHAAVGDARGEKSKLSGRSTPPASSAASRRRSATASGPQGKSSDPRPTGGATGGKRAKKGVKISHAEAADVLNLRSRPVGRPSFLFPNIFRGRSSPDVVPDQAPAANASRSSDEFRGFTEVDLHDGADPPLPPSSQDNSFE